MEARTELVWLGQSAFKITTPGGKVIVTDPWLRTNPLTPPAYKQLDAFGRIDVLLVSHGHFDHIADAPALAQQYNVPIAVIPMHYGANPLARGTAKEFVDAMGASTIRVIVAVPGQPIPF